MGDGKGGGWDGKGGGWDGKGGADGKGGGYDGKGDGKGGGKDKKKGGKGDWNKGPSAPPDHEAFERLSGLPCEGQVRTWKEPWGFITSHLFQGDLFAHKEQVADRQDLEAGQAVSFFIGRDEKSGRWRAQQITLNGPDLKRARME